MTLKGLPGIMMNLDESKKVHYFYSNHCFDKGRAKKSSQ
jgi:hypothetical protein